MRRTIGEFYRDIDRSLRKDQRTFVRRLRRIEKNYESGHDISMHLTELAKQIESSIAFKAHRISRTPNIIFPDLPVVEKREDIAQAILEHQVVIICGETGSGKTTQLPKICLSLGRGSDGFIGHTQPRRIAARSVAARIAQELGEKTGQMVSYKIRFQDNTKPESRIKLMTDGILLAETQSDRYLDQYDTLIIDEAHERSLNIDFMLGYLKWLLPKRTDLKVIITSATFDAEKFSKHFGDAFIVKVEGRNFPVEVRYRALKTEEASEKEFHRTILDAVDELGSEAPGDILVFLSGEREIRETAEILRKHYLEQFEILALYSRLSVAEQNRIFHAHKKPRIVLATNVAETSLTVPGIRYVIDIGTARISRYSPRSKLQRLPIECISKASARQRAGRCGRLGPGICIRLYSVDDFESRPEYTDPEILRTNLAAVILTMKALGLNDIQSFPFVDPPDNRMIRDGIKLLQELKAIDLSGELTALGRKISRFPIDPRLGCMVLAAEKENCVSEVVVIVSALSIQDPRERPAEFTRKADECHARFQADHSDFLGFLKLWTDFQEKNLSLSQNKMRRYCRQHFLSYRRMREWQDIYKQLMALVEGELRMKANQVPAEYDEIHRALLSGLLDNIGFKHESFEYLGPRNQKFFIHPSSGQFLGKPKWVMCSEQVETTKVFARNIAKIEPTWIETMGAHLVKRNYYEPHWERKVARVAVYEHVTLYGLTISKGRKVPYEKVDSAGAREIFIRSALVNQDYQTTAVFFKQNQALLDSKNYLHHKGRRADLMVDEELIFRFYDERIPQPIVNGAGFEKWLKKQIRTDPNILTLSDGFFGSSHDCELNKGEFPDHFELGSIKSKLEYRFEPGHEEDGVTVVVPVHQLNQLEPSVFEWIVPGLLREKIIALIKALPKSIRRKLVPAAHYANRCMEELDRARPSLHESLALSLSKMSGTVFDKSIWTDVKLDNYLEVNYKVIDKHGVDIESSRDLLRLKQKYQSRSADGFRRLAEKNTESRSGFTTWDMGDLPERIEIKNGGHSFFGYPAVIDEGDSVGIRKFETEIEAKIHHRQGLIRLVQISLSQDIKYLRKNLIVQSISKINYGRLKAHPFLYQNQKSQALEDALVTVVLAAVFIDGQSDIRSGDAFRKRLKDFQPKLMTTANKACELLNDILTNYFIINKKLNTALPKYLIDDITEQLEVLIYQGFLIHTPISVLKEFPRYLRAILFRLEKGSQDIRRDESKLMELSTFWKNYWEHAKLKTEINAIGPENDPFRWNLEEFRVSLFAQQLKTAYPISVKRLEKAWQKRALL